MANMEEVVKALEQCRSVQISFEERLMKISRSLHGVEDFPEEKEACGAEVAKATKRPGIMDMIGYNLKTIDSTSNRINSLLIAIEETVNMEI